MSDLTDAMAQGDHFYRHPFARLAWTRLSEDEVVLFCQGESLSQPGNLRDAVRLIAEQRRIDSSAISDLLAIAPAAGELLLLLLNEGLLEHLENQD